MSYDPVLNPGAATANPRMSANYDDESLQPPPGFHNLAGNRESFGSPSNLSFESSQPLNAAGNAPYRDDPNTAGDSTFFAEKDAPQGMAYPPTGSPPLDLQANRKKRRPWLWIVGILALLAVIIVAVIIPIYFKVIKPHSSSAAASSSSGGGAGKPTPTTSANSSGIVYEAAITGGLGSTVTTETGTTFTYNNPYGGFWVADPKDPYNNNAQAQSWSPPLNQTWTWGVDVVRGVNLGGWLVPEPFITPALFEPYQNGSIIAIDEWTLSQNMAADTANGGLNQLVTHYDTFITEEDFAKIAAAGLNWVRLGIPFWAMQKYDEEPFLEGACWTYALKAFAWARKYGLRINLDLHTMPGSQNGYNHSGKWGQVDFLYGAMGIANSQRGLHYMRVITEFITQKEFANLIPYLGVMNEPKVMKIGQDVMGSFYLNMHDVLRNITGLGEGKGPYLSIHDGFLPLSKWADFLPGRDRMAMDSHPYMCFTTPDTDPLSAQVDKPCKSWAAEFNTSWSTFGVTTAGEWSLAVNDCGLWVNGVNQGTRWEGTLSDYSGPSGNDPNGCTEYNDWQSWNETTKGYYNQIALSSMDALQNWFFWTWKIGNSSITGNIEAPFWSYSLGLEQGWIPTDPRVAVGTCGGASPAQPLQPIMTGGAGSGDFAQSVRDANPWPPLTLQPSGFSGTLLPTYTATGPIPTLPMPTFTSAAAQSTDDGWFDPSDTMPMYTPIAGCDYPDPWNAENNTIPEPCTGTPTTRRRVRQAVALPKRTAAP